MICACRPCDGCGKKKTPCESNSSSKPFIILTGTSWTEIRLKERPRADRTIHSDDDCIRDWQEIITTIGSEKGKVRWNNTTKRAILPTIDEMRKFGHNSVDIDGLNRFLEKQMEDNRPDEFNSAKHFYEMLLKTEILPLEDTIVFMTDKPLENDDYRIYLVGDFATKKKHFYIPNHELFNDLEVIKADFSMTSRASRYGDIEYQLNGETFIKLGASFGSLHNDQMSLIAWDDLVDEDTLFKIANSFRSER